MRLRTVAIVIFSLFCARTVSAQSLPSKAQSSAKAESRPSAPELRTFVLVGAGDIAWCGNLLGAEATAKLIDQIPGTVFAAGDLAYERGTYEEFEQC